MATERRCPAKDERDIVDVLKKQRLDHARPWEAISPDYLTTREFLSLAGVGGGGRKYLQTLFYLEIASRKEESAHLLPDYLKRCFRDGSVRVHVFRSRSEGLIGVEYAFLCRARWKVRRSHQGDPVVQERQGP